MNILNKFVATLAAVTLLSACEQQKQDSAEVGAIPKEILDKATNDIKAAEALVTEKMQAAENIDVSEDEAK